MPMLIYLHVKPRNLIDAVRMINMDISNVANWASGNGFSLNPKKTMAMIMGTTRYINSLSSYVLPRVTVNSITIPYNDFVEYLGVTISNTILEETDLQNNIENICNRSSAQNVQASFSAGSSNSAGIIAYFTSARLQLYYFHRHQRAKSSTAKSLKRLHKIYLPGEMG